MKDNRQYLLGPEKGALTGLVKGTNPSPLDSETIIIELWLNYIVELALRSFAITTTLQTMMLIKLLSCCALLSAHQTAIAFSPSFTKSRTSSAAVYSTSSSDGKEESSLVVDVDGRREFLSSSVATLVAGCLTLSTPSTANAKVKSSVDYKAVAKDIASIIKSDPDKGPTLVRLVSMSSRE